MANLETLSAEQLAEEPLFGDVPAPSLKKMLGESEVKTHPNGEQLCLQEDLTTEFFLILQGQVAVFDEKPGGREELTRVDAHDWVGEMSALSCAPRSATLEAVGPTTVLTVPQHAFRILYADKKAAPFKDRIDERYRERALANHLGKAKLFRGLPPEALDRLADVSTLAFFEENEVLFQEGDAGDDFFLVRSGQLKTTKRGPDGRPLLLAYNAENSFFGEVALVRDQPRSATVTAITRCDVVRIPRDAFRSVLKDWPAIEERIHRHLADLDRGHGMPTQKDVGLMVHSKLSKAGEALVINLDRCTHCNMCVEACIESHDDRTPRISKRGVSFDGGTMLLASSCYNCNMPDCMLSCRFGAILRKAQGLVVIDAQACTGCSKCEKACPYGAIQMQSLVGITQHEEGFLAKLPVIGRLFRRAKEEAAEVSGAKGRPAPKALAVKCDLCAERGDMACIYYCPYSAIERVNPQELVT